MIAPHWAPDPRMESWGLSFSRAVRFGRFMFGHGGGVLGGWNSMLLVVPGEDLALIVHANTAFDDFPKLVSRLLAATLDGRTSAPVARPVSPDLLGLGSGFLRVALPGDLTNFRVKGAVGRLQIKAADGALSLHARRGVWKNGVRLSPADPADDTYFQIADDELEPSALRFVRGGGAVTGLRYGLVEMARTQAVPGWA